MPKIQFYLLDIRRDIINNKQAILLFGKTLNNERVCIIDKSFLPYFYVMPKKNLDIKEKLEKLEVERDKKISKVIKTETVQKKILGEKIDVIKVYVPFFRDIKVIKSIINEWEIIDNIYEYDIPYLRSYLIEKEFVISNLLETEAEPFNAGFKVDTFLAKTLTMNTEESIKSPKILAFDIETYNPEGKNIDMKNNAILMISFYGENLKKVFTWKRFKTDKDYIEFVNSEAEIIEKFVETIDKYAPDIITGYNTDYFDFPYLNERSKKYKIPLNIGLNNSTVRLALGENKRARIPGIIHIDSFRFIKKAPNISGPFSLDNISKKLLGRSKKEKDIKNLYKIWDSGTDEINEYCEYNLTDSELAYELCKKFLPQILELTKITGLTVDNIVRLGYSQIVESFLLRQTKSFNELAPNRPDKTEIAKRFLESYTGSFVFEPIPGLYNNIIVFDFRSLYPTIITSHNISPDTIDCDCCDNGTNIAPEEKESENHFCKNKKGFLQKILEDLITRRTRIKDIIKKENPFLNAREENLKLLANSFYGYLGFYGSRWYSIESARAITAWGRHYIKKVIGLAQEDGFTIIYSDTDSIFIALKDKKEEDAIALLDKVNSSLPGLMELEFEGVYTRGLFVSAKEKSSGAKKKYALLSKKGEIKIKGFATVRKNWSAIGRKVQSEVISIILKLCNDENALRFVQKTIDKIRNKEIENKDTIIETTLQKNLDKYDSQTPHVRVAKIMKERGMEVKAGTSIKYIITEGEGRISERARLPDSVEEGGYDSEYYINNQVVPAVEKIFELFGYKKEDISKEKGQKSLGEF